MSISMKEVHILIQESALDAMRDRAARMHREMNRLREELQTLEDDIEDKKELITGLRDKWLLGGVV
jgi:hypothetical protein